MSVIKSTSEMKDRQLAEKMEQEDREGWDQLQVDLKDPSKWKTATGENLAMIEASITRLREQRKRTGRPPAEKPFKGIHINLPLDLLDELRLRAAKLNVGYQTYIKMALTKHIDKDEAIRLTGE